MARTDVRGYEVARLRQVVRPPIVLNAPQALITLHPHEAAKLPPTSQTGRCRDTRSRLGFRARRGPCGGRLHRFLESAKRRARAGRHHFRRLPASLAGRAHLGRWQLRGQQPLDPAARRPVAVLVQHPAARLLPHDLLVALGGMAAVGCQPAGLPCGERLPPPGRHPARWPCTTACR